MPRKASVPHDRLIVALLANRMKEAEAMVKLLKDDVRIFEIGIPTFTALGPDVVTMVHRHHSRVLLDLKYHDIPSTVAAAVTNAAELGVDMMTVHAVGGFEMLGRAADTMKSRAKTRATTPKLIAVTVLTSMESLGDIGVQFEVRDQVVRLAKMAKKAGFDGVVASPLEVRPVRVACGEKFLIVTTGIRPLGTAIQDQRRVSSPTMAMAAGADYLVVGRPVVESRNPKAVVQSIIREIS
ncbi:MAG: orotidine-5'-phosphate decarboxylase [Deltaproteobacteria bacterium]|nr:orotidine-5'-phosphate decarboxylase [Deltaproteobacteria bacterium]